MSMSADVNLDVLLAAMMTLTLERLSCDSPMMQLLEMIGLAHAVAAGLAGAGDQTSVLTSDLGSA